MRRRLLVLGLALGSAAVLTGCTLAPTVAPPAVFDLGPAAPSAGSGAPLALRLHDVVAAPALESSAIGYRLVYRDPFRREVYRDSRWAAPPAALVGQRLRLRLAQRPCAPSAVAMTAEAPTLHLVLDEFGQEFSSATQSRGLVRLRAAYRTAAAGPGAAAAERVFEVSREAASADARGGVQALSTALDQALDEVLAWVLQLAPAAACR